MGKTNKQAIDALQKLRRCVQDTREAQRQDAADGAQAEPFGNAHGECLFWSILSTSAN